MAYQTDIEYTDTELDTMTPVLLKNVKRGEFIRRKRDSGKTYIRGEYDREFKRYVCDDTSDISKSMLLRGSTIVFVGFTY